MIRILTMGQVFELTFSSIACCYTLLSAKGLASSILVKKFTTVGCENRVIKSIVETCARKESRISSRQGLSPGFYRVPDAEELTNDSD